MYPSRRSALFLMFCCLVALTACQQAAALPPSAPEDFAVVYHYNVGSLPPEYYYEYTIYIDHSGGMVTYQHGYGDGDEGFEMWSETFPLAPEQVEALYDTMVEQGVWSRRWQQEEQMPTGGDVEWLEVTAQGESVEVPTYVAGADNQRAIREVYSAINTLLPDAIRARITE